MKLKCPIRLTSNLFFIYFCFQNPQWNQCFCEFSSKTPPKKQLKEAVFSVRNWNQTWNWFQNSPSNRTAVESKRPISQIWNKKKTILAEDCPKTSRQEFWSGRRTFPISHPAKNRRGRARHRRFSKCHRHESKQPFQSGNLPRKK